VKFGGNMAEQSIGSKMNGVAITTLLVEAMRAEEF
jgi:hypothetical protein